MAELEVIEHPRSALPGVHKAGHDPTVLLLTDLRLLLGPTDLPSIRCVILCHYPPIISIKAFRPSPV